MHTLEGTVTILVMAGLREDPMAIRLYKPTLVSLLALSTVLLGDATIARAQRFTVFDAPNANDTVVRKINNRGDVLGIEIIFPNTLRGFVRDEKGSFTVFDATPQARTDPADINAPGRGCGNLRGSRLCAEPGRGYYAL